MKANISINEFVSLQRRLLELELKSEEDEERIIVSSVVTSSQGSKSGTTNSKNRNNNNDNNNDDDKEEIPSHVLRNLDVSDISVGLFGRTVVTLVPISSSGSGSGDSSNSSTTKPGTALLLPSHKFTVGDEIEIYSKRNSHNGKNNNNNNNGVGGVISCITDTNISIALFSSSSSKKNGTNNNISKDKDVTTNTIDDDDDNDMVVGEPPLSIVPKSSIEVHNKLLKALSELEKYGVSHPICGKIINSLFSIPEENRHRAEASSSSAAALLKKIEPFNKNLDNSQLEAISFALQQDTADDCNDRPPVALIHGPPGTGKTTTVAELIHQAVHVHKMKVLVTAPSNVAVDNILERLVDNNNNSVQKSKGQTKRRGKQVKNKDKVNTIRAVRLGHPARIKPSIIQYSLESLVQNSDGQEIVSDVRNELQSFLRILSNPKSRGNDKRIAYREVKTLRKELKQREEKIVQTLLSQCHVVLSTNVGAANRLLDKCVDEHGFDLVIIDECAQALESSCWIPILRGRRLVLAGDHCQLPPTIKSKSYEVQKGLGKTLFERIVELYSNGKCQNNKDNTTASTQNASNEVSRMLRVQYRMHENISDWASNAMYRGELQTDQSVRYRTLSQLPNVEKIMDSSSDKDEDVGNNYDEEATKATLLLMDTAGCDMHESVSASGSRYNDGEAQLVALHIRRLLEAGLKAEEIAVISPYNGQVELLRTMLLPDNPKLEIRSVDGFQGGEREAVVLSLVRSSDRGGRDGIGFLKDNRRLNVAVTRAKRHLALICDTETVCQSDFIKTLIAWMEEKGEQRSAIDYMVSPSVTVADLEADLNEVKIEMMSEKNNSHNLNSNRMSSKGMQQIKEGDDRRKAILDKISNFAESGTKGDELALSCELSKFDRKVVHEFATELGLGHRSEGIEGIDRRIIVSIEKEVEVLEGTKEAQEREEGAVGRQGDDIKENGLKLASFAALEYDSDDSAEKTDDADAVEAQKLTTPDSIAPMNSLLKSLAEERNNRQQQEEQQSTKNKNKKKKKKGKKLGGKPVDKVKDGGGDADENIDDDMAFLDAQIEKVQTSHGRTVKASGKEYKSIVNGILLAKPPPREKKRNTNALSALDAKLKKAQNDRKVSSKGKKKK